MTLNKVPSFREMVIEITSRKFKGNIDQRAWRDNKLTDELLAIRNFTMDITESGLIEQILKDTWMQEALVK